MKGTARKRASPKVVRKILRLQLQLGVVDHPLSPQLTPHPQLTARAKPRGLDVGVSRNGWQPSVGGKLHECPAIPFTPSQRR